MKKRTWKGGRGDAKKSHTGGKRFTGSARPAKFGGYGKPMRSGKPAGKMLAKPSAGTKWQAVDNPKARSNRREHAPTPPAFVKKSAAAKLVQALQDKKTRNERKLFLVEGQTSVIEALEFGFVPETLFVTHPFLDEYPEILEHFKKTVQIVDEAELSGMGTLVTNKSAIGVFKQKELPPLVIASEVVLALANVNDPGNLGTIIRIADWYGIKKIVASRDTVDVYNPKVISATKGSFARVDVYYQDLESFLAKNETVPVFAADMQGDDVHGIDFPMRGILLLGNETHGIPSELSDVITKYVTIPRFGGAESLNVAIAGAVILDNWLR